MDVQTALELRVNSLEAVIALGVIGITAALLRRPPREVGSVEVMLQVNENAEARVLRLHPPITIGRGQDALLRVHDLHASRLHAIIDVEDGFAFVEDLGSRNGTLVNARPIDGRVRLNPGDEVGVGRVRIVFSGEVPWT